MTTLKLFDIEHAWGLPRKISPRFGARLILRGLHLDYLNDRASFVGEFSPEVCKRFNHAFPKLVKQLERLVVSGEIDAREQHCVTIEYDDFTCEADTLGSHGYLYIAVYQSADKPLPALTLAPSITL
ncbi:type IV toxin-antitoxin system YeeU family antitoxin [Shewanella baltica]|uniref:type IV toxin-antitoxin system YeeU family antitoxin n=1 Tax=Shewanella baltica TaxID=62322 RepID=UPI00217CEBB3|nr:type IV toxin-antitoxin system YeeU family antitoxin [Shewanella baltica]MCS6178913.1 type IV toxin-antitoxin system YeeU family antitoxin [Shewanella baltica]MCS6255077.1 type IV toxin-antitoxin system YeeU family antitoxin [Shewanella baltica]